MEEGKLIDSEKGTPQGAVLSPVLANIYLHFVLDLWFEKVIKRKVKGFVQLIRYADDFIVLFQIAKEAEEFGRKLRERLSKPPHPSGWGIVKGPPHQFLVWGYTPSSPCFRTGHSGWGGKFGLKIAEEKSKIIWFGQYAWQKAQIEGKRLDTFDFLGFTHYCDKTRGGKVQVRAKDSKQEIQAESQANESVAKECS